MKARKKKINKRHVTDSMDDSVARFPKFGEIFLFLSLEEYNAVQNVAVELLAVLLNVHWVLRFILFLKGVEGPMGLGSN